MTGSATLSATVKEAVAESEVPIKQEEVAQASAGPSRPGTSQAGRPEQPDVRPAASGRTSTRFASSALGTARSHVSRSTAPSFPAIGSTSSNAVTHPYRIESAVGGIRCERISSSAIDTRTNGSHRSSATTSGDGMSPQTRSTSHPTRVQVQRWGAGATALSRP